MHDEQQITVAKPPHVAVRTCIGCRRIALATDLVRIGIGQGDEPQLDPNSNSASATVGGAVVVDAKRSLPGRGAWLHLDHSCFTLAERRKAFSRALRVAVADTSAVSEYFRRHAMPKEVD